ncbi:hypothetical protein Salat_2700300 [Sesamum alatum]|uniref:Uncharacterized protein n=1 Tax=Sesamum alatum TaxID=300844 RepID=A0AAE1XPY7_9LAMI|nr:hypothetical protein Salat_2700300 [Sesamum alatum]
MFRNDKAVAEQQIQNLQQNLSNAQTNEKEAIEAKVALDVRVAELEAKVSDLEAQATVEENKHVVADALESGSTGGFSAGCFAARDFLKAPAFKMAIDIQSVIFLNEGFDTCISQVHHLRGFVDGFDQSRLEPSLDATLQPYPEENVPKVAEHDEFEAQIAEVERPPLAPSISRL